MLCYSEGFTTDLPASYIAFDSEWTKNFQIKNGNRPFCFSLVAIQQASVIDEDVTVQAAWAYIESTNEIPNLITTANRIVGRFRSGGKHIFVGHQLSSDLAALTRFDHEADFESDALEALWEAWHARKGEEGPNDVFDTRYDLESQLTIRSRRLVDVCVAFGLNVMQPELGSQSMTSLQRKYMESENPNIRERLQVMNIRHALSCGILAHLGRRDVCWTPMNLNRVLYRNLRSSFDYLESESFQQLL